MSGGEPTLQSDFAKALLQRAKERGIHTAMETCGYASSEILKDLLPDLDLILYDVKQMDEALHRTYTGVSNQLILRNLRELCASDGRTQVIVRAPVIPGYNDQETNYRTLAEYLMTMERIPCVEILPYNPLAGSKYPRIGMDYQPGSMKETDGTPPEELCRILTRTGISARVVR